MRNQSYYRRNFNREIFQVKEDIPERGTERPTIWTTTKDGGADKQAITFTDEDARRVHRPYDDAIIITLLITDYTTRRELVDNGSSVDILYYLAFQ